MYGIDPPSTLPSAGGGVATEPQMAGPASRLDLFDQGAAAAKPEECAIAGSLEPLADAVVPKWYAIQRGGRPAGMRDELREGRNEAILDFRREGKELALGRLCNSGQPRRAGPLTGTPSWLQECSSRLCAGHNPT